MKKKRKSRKKRNNPRASPATRIQKGFFSFLKLGLSLPGKIKRQILASLFLLLAVIFLLSFFEKAGKGGEFLRRMVFDWFGHSIYIIPGVFFLAAICSFIIPKRLLFLEILAILLVIMGTSGLISVLKVDSFSGGKVVAALSRPLVAFFGELVGFMVFLTLLGIGLSMFWYLFTHLFLSKEKEQRLVSQMIKKAISFPKFEISRVEPEEKTRLKKEKLLPLGVSSQEIARPKFQKFVPPPPELLEKDEGKALPGDIKQNAIIIKQTLQNFGIEVAMAQINIGPTVTQYTLKPAEGVRLSKITSLSNNLALALAAHPIRIEAPIPGKALVGIEIPNKARSTVRLRDLIEHPDFRKDSSTLNFVLGRGVAGEPIFADLSRLPHLLVAGATGTGKTIFLNGLVLSLLYQNAPETLRFILIDPKRVEFPFYGELPHLLCPVVLDAERAVNALKWLVNEMERRFGVLMEARAKDIASFNNISSQKGEEILSYIVVIIDELADLMAARGKEMEAGIVRIAQMARAVGIHLVVATQRPSVEVLTGLIKANITSRVGFQVASQFDSRTIMDSGGSEKLLGLGDMLYISSEFVKPKRIQGSFVSEKEVKKVVAWIKKNTEPETLEKDLIGESFQEDVEKMAPGLDSLGFSDDPLCEKAKEVVIRAQKASASLLQRRLQIGYARAARLLDILEAEGIVGPLRGAKPRKVFVKPKEESFE